MLRIRRSNIRVDYTDPYLALTSLLVDAATLEHSLLAMYLYAMFSVRDRYANLRGELTSKSFQPQPPGRNAIAPPAVARPPATFLDVTIEEMQHLALVNQLLYELCAAPCLERHSFPHRFEIYPFPLELRSLDRFVAATFTWIEAPRDALRHTQGNDLVKKLEHVLNATLKRDVIAEFREGQQAEPVGSLYGSILEQLDKLRSDPPPFIPDNFPWGVWSDRIDWIRHQGEIAHYEFFRSLFDGSAFDADESIWDDPKAAAYPTRKLEWKSAFPSRSVSFTSSKDPRRRLAWLSNLIYWTLLCLLDVSYRTNNRKLIYLAVEQMASGLWWIGLDLAHKHRIGMPFDVMLVRYNLGRDERSTLAIIERLVLEAKRLAVQLGAEEIDGKSALPERFDPGLFDRTLDALRPRA